MTTWQWRIIITLCKVVIKLVEKAQGEPTEFYSSDIEDLKLAVDRQTHSGHREKQRTEP